MGKKLKKKFIHKLPGVNIVPNPIPIIGIAVWDNKLNTRNYWGKKIKLLGQKIKLCGQKLEAM